MYILQSHNYDHEIRTESMLSAVHDAPKSTVIATATFYPSKDGVMHADNALRAKLALQTFKVARDKGYQMVVSDGNSDKGWRQEAADLGVLLLDEAPGRTMGSGRREALAAAGEYGKPVVVWMEPEKYPLIQEERNSFDMNSYQGRSPIGMSVAPVLNGNADIVVPRRMDELASYPEQQRFAELHGNMTVRDIFRSYLMSKGASADEAAEHIPYLDLWIGPRAMNRMGLERFLEYDGKLLNKDSGEWDLHDRWESIFVPVWNALLAGDRVAGVAVPYVHPRVQTEAETGKYRFSEKRDDQFITLRNAALKTCDTYDAKN